MAVDDPVAPTILEYVTNNTYPTSETTSSASLTPSTLATLTKSLQTEQEDIKSQIRTTSLATSGDIDTWILRAKELQKDILKSRELAREIVQEAEKSKKLKSKVNDHSSKVSLLEGEVGFLDNVRARLESVGRVGSLLADVQDALAKSNFVTGLRALNGAEDEMRKIELNTDSGVGSVLSRRLEQLKDELRETVRAAWKEKIDIRVENKSVLIKTGLDDVVTAAESLGLFSTLVTDLTRDLEKAVLRPRMSVDRTGRVPRIQASNDRLVCSSPEEESHIHDLLTDLGIVLDYMSSRLPASVSTPLSQGLLPAICSRLEDEWLQPAIPLDIAEMPAFQEILSVVSAFADKIDGLGWTGSQPLRDWVQGAARFWLTKRREALLGDVRNLVFTGLRATKEVERVETQMINDEQGLGKGTGGGDDDWDTAWDEPEETVAPPLPARQAPVTTEDDDDASAWDLPEDEEPGEEEGKDEEEAWGWGDGEEPSQGQQKESSLTPQPLTNVNGQSASTKPSQREMTLRETFTVTDIPDGILALLQQVVRDAGTLAGPEYAATPIAPAAAALYTLPTLALAIYRATAPTAYNKLVSGNMLIYNDANRLSDQLRSWQSSQPSASRLRLDNDVKALDEFARRAYSAEMDSQRTILDDLLDGAQGFSNCTAQPNKMECESAVEQTTDRLRDVHKEWKPILSNSALLQSIGSLLSTVTSKMIREIEDLPDIGEADSKELKSLCDQISSVKDLFVQISPDGETREMTFIYCPTWFKFQYLAEIMESSLADIRYLWNEAELGLEFEGEEVVGLIEALFAESSLRRQAIQDIRRGGRR